MPEGKKEHTEFGCLAIGLFWVALPLLAIGLTGNSAVLILAGVVIALAVFFLLQAG